MTLHAILKDVRIHAVAVTLGVACALPAAAQTSNGTPAATTGSTSTTVREDSRFDWGWLGLLGLAGLVGLRRREDPVVTRPATTR